MNFGSRESAFDTDAEFEGLLAGAKRGCALSLGKLLEASRQYLNVIAARELGPDLQAKQGKSDLVQETFLQAHASFPTFRGTSHPELQAWLRGILVNKLAKIRTRYRDCSKRDVSREVPLNDGTDSDRPEAVVPSREPSPGSRLTSKEEAELLKAAMSRLPEHYRLVMELYHRDGESYDEIGRRMGRSAEAVRKLWTRAVEQLSRELRAP